MSSKRRLQTFLLHIIFLIFNIGMLFGLTTFYYSTKHKSFRDSRILNRYCKFMAVAFFVLYPVSLVSLLDDFSASEGIIYSNGKCWLCLIAIFLRRIAIIKLSYIKHSKLKVEYSWEKKTLRD